jgi:ribonuclease HIII
MAPELVLKELRELPSSSLPDPVPNPPAPSKAKPASADLFAGLRLAKASDEPAPPPKSSAFSPMPKALPSASNAAAWNSPPSARTLSPLGLPKAHIGSDESGKGDFFGPLVVAGVYCDEEAGRALERIGVRDSKLSSDDENLSMADQIKSALGPERFEIRVLPPLRYNRLYDERLNNLNKILARLHAEVIAELSERFGCGHALIDKFGSDSLVHAALRGLGLEMELVQIPKAERYTSVAAASILARAEFLKELETECGGFLDGAPLPKGAGSPADNAGRRLLKKLGPERLKGLVKLHFANSKKIGLK